MRTVNKFILLVLFLLTVVCVFAQTQESITHDTTVISMKKPQVAPVDSVRSSDTIPAKKTYQYVII